MTKKNPALLNTLALISLAMFGYLLFFTVYRQMISQNEGVFYVLVFGGVLILAFILLSLMTKLLAFSEDAENSVGFIIMEILFLLALSVLFVRMRITYQSSVPEEESICYKVAELMQEQALGFGGEDVMSQLVRRPSAYLMGALMSAIFSMSQDPSGLIIYINTFLLLSCGFFAYGIVRRIGSRICSLFVFLITLYMPSIGFSVYNYDAQLLFAFMLMLAIFLSVIPMTATTPKAGSVVACIFAGIAWGIVVFMEPVSILILLAFLLLGRIGEHSMRFSLISFAIAVVITVLMIVIFSVSIGQPFPVVLQGMFSRFNPFSTDTGSVSSFPEIISNFNDKIDAQLRSITENYYFLAKEDGTTLSSVGVAWMQLGSQVLYMFLLILSIACAFYMIRSHNARIIPVLSAIISGFLMIFLSSANEYNIAFYLMLIVMTGGVSLQYMYENHHALADRNMQQMLGETEEETDKEHVEETPEETEEEKAAFIARAQALIFIGMNEEYYKQIKLSEKRQAQQKKEQKEEPPAAHPDKIVPVKQELQDREQSFDRESDAEPEKELFSDQDPEKETEQKKTEKKKIEYLESPLPLPKKHQPKDLDYDRVNTDDQKTDDFNDFDMSDDEDWEFDLNEEV